MSWVGKNRKIKKSWGGRLFGNREDTDMLVYRSFHSNDIYLFKVNNGKTGKMCEICSKLTITTPERPP